MLFAATTIVALAASVSAAAVPAANYGTWTLSLSQNYESTQYLTSVYKSEAHPEGLKVSCVYNPTENPPFYNCDQTTMQFQYDGETLKLQQTIVEPARMTVWGEAPVTLVHDAYHKQSRAEATVEATKYNIAIKLS